MLALLLIIVVLMLVGALPRWRYSSNWGYAPSTGLTLALIVIVALILVG